MQQEELLPLDTFPENDTNCEQHVADHKVNYKHLVAVEFLDVIPKNPSGKLLRRFLRDKAKQLKESGKLVVPTRRKAKL